MSIEHCREILAVYAVEIAIGGELLQLPRLYWVGEITFEDMMKFVVRGDLKMEKDLSHLLSHFLQG